MEDLIEEIKHLIVATQQEFDYRDMEMKQNW